MKGWKCPAERLRPGESITEFVRRVFGFDFVASFEARINPQDSFPQGNYLDLYEVLWMLSERFIIADCFQAFQETDASIIRWLKRHPRSSPHDHTKVQAARWLARVHGIRSVAFEVPYQAGVADVASKDGVWYIECGGSPPSKIPRFFSGPQHSRNRLVLFNTNGITIFRKGPRLRHWSGYMMVHSVAVTALDGLHAGAALRPDSP